MLRKKKQSQGDDGPKVPGYIVTFSDMVTLLLTFFVMLLSLATTQDPDLFNSGRDSFVKSIRGLGLGVMFGKDATVEHGQVQYKHRIENPDDTRERRTIDAQAERTRRKFQQLQNMMATTTSPLSGEQVDFPASDVRFAARGSNLDDSDKKSLKELCQNLSSNGRDGSVKLYVLGLAAKGRTEKDKWILSARRAKAVADFLRTHLAGDDPIPVYSWGAGPGRIWTNEESSISPDSHIAIAVIR